MQGSVDADNDLEMQDDMYDGDGKNEKRENPRKVEFNFEAPIDDGLLYDPSMDDDDATWVKKERQKYVPKKGKDFTAKFPSVKIINFLHLRL